ncbi:MAG: Uncharacterized protein G01um101433_247 [Parcubacteria group bacterium Gr01-1014_33]|nr:MAG: Uncharacterized protein G01um101433_247 [Parcubacteria group bacterium Gr01-1014_33]
MRTSYSAIETYLQCPQKYKFQEIDKIRKPKSREAIFGTLVHSTLKFMFQKDPLFPTLDEVVAYFRAHWPLPEVFEQESKNDPLKHGWTEEEQKIYFEEGVRMLKKFYEKNAPWNFSVVDVESRFEAVIADEKTGETHILAGIIDRIDKRADGSYEIIDYKTSKRMPSQDAVDKNLQLSLYSLGLQKRWPHITPEMITLSLYFLKHGEKLSTQSTAETTEKTKAHILGTISEIQERIAEKKEFEPMPSPLCDWCAYKPICPAWRHLYRKSQSADGTSREEIQKAITEYFEIKTRDARDGKRLKELQDEIKKYMEQEGVTRIFGDEGMISKKKTERYEYDFEKIKALLSPLGKWEEMLKPDEIKLRKVMSEISADVRDEIEAARKVKSEYITLTASAKKISGVEFLNKSNL